MSNERSNLRAKLQTAIDSISVDVFGYEKKITKKVIQYMTEMASQEGFGADQVYVRIVRANATIRVFLHHSPHLFREIPVRELVAFFAGQAGADLFKVEGKVIRRIVTYMEGFSRFHGVPKNGLQLLIAARNSKVIVSGHNGAQYLKDIPVKELINFFKP